MSPTTVPAADLAPVLARAAALSGGSGHVHLSALNGSLLVRAVDAQATVQLDAEVAAEVQGGWECVVAAGTLRDAVKTLRRSVSLRLSKGTLKVSAGGASFGLRTSDDPLPTLREASPKAPGALVADVDGAALATALAGVRGTIGDPTRYGLNGVCVETAPGALLLTSTDGAALSHVPLPAQVQGDAPKGQLLPPVLLAALAPLAAGTADVRIVVDAPVVEARGAGWVLRARLLVGEFPDWRRVVPAEGRARVHVQVRAAALREALAAVSLLAADKHHTTRITLSGDTVALSASSADAGDARVDLQAEDVLGEAPGVPWHVNASLLGSALACAERYAPVARIGLDEALAPLRIDVAPEMPAALAPFWVVMPMRGD